MADRSCIEAARAGIISCLIDTFLLRRQRVWIIAGPVLLWLAWLLSLPPRPSWWIVFVSGAPWVALGSWLAQRGAATHPGWREFVRATADYHVLALILLFALAIQFEDAHGVTTDGVIYFTQLRSVIFDRDLDVTAEFAALGQPPRPYHVVPLGPTFVWVPLYLAVAVVDAAGRAAGLWTAPGDSVRLGLTLPYVRAALVSSFAIGAAGVVVVHRLLRREFGVWVALTATVLLLGATPLFWYMVYEPSMTHAASFGFVAIFIAAAVRWTRVDMPRRHAVALGALLGLAFITRPQEALFALYPALVMAAAPASWTVRVRAALSLARWAALGALAFLLAQAVHSYILMSREQFALVGAGGYLTPLSSRWSDTLWSSWHGFLSWSPAVYVAVLGTVIYVRRNQAWASAAVLILLLMAWVNGSTADWPAGWSFGGRRFTSCLVLLAPGLALVVDALVRRPLTAAAIVGAGAVVWNQLLFVQYSSGMVPKEGPVSFAQLVRGQASVLTRPPYFYPFAFPANAAFAWQHGLPIDSYDLLSPESFAPAFELTLDDRASRFLAGGWGARGQDAAGAVRWMDGPRAELFVPFDPAGRAEVTLSITARTRLVDPPVAVPLQVAINGHPVGSFSPDAAEASTGRFVVRGSALTRGFNRVVLSKPFDTPPIAIAALAMR
jgi:hypothetical protein